MGDALIHLPIRLTLKKTLQFRVIQNLLAPVERWSSKKNRARPHQARPNQAEEGLRSRCSDDDVIARSLNIHRGVIGRDGSAAFVKK